MSDCARRRAPGIMARMSADPPSGTVERWAFDLVTATALELKTRPPAPPDAWEAAPPVRRLEAPGRPPELEVVPKVRRSVRRAELRDPRKRARLLHTFWHHELQAAELLAWAILAFPDAPHAFRAGLLRVCRDELRHMRMYEGALRELGAALGDFPVRDWFWTRVPRCATPLQFAALLGLGLEGGNLDHSARYVEWFEAVGDHRGAEVQRVVGREEIAHVRFAASWFREWTGGVDFERWRQELVEPLTPRLLCGRPLNRKDRLLAGLPAEFVDALEAHEESPQ